MVSGSTPQCHIKFGGIEGGGETGQHEAPTSTAGSFLTYQSIPGLPEGGGRQWCVRVVFSAIVCSPATKTHTQPGCPQAHKTHAHNATSTRRISIWACFCFRSMVSSWVWGEFLLFASFSGQYESVATTKATDTSELNTEHPCPRPSFVQGGCLPWPWQGKPTQQEKE